jgi:hypothetical protein
MRYEELLTKIIDAGIEVARADYAKRSGDLGEAMLRGSIEGFEACRGKQPDEIAKLYREADRAGMWTDDPPAYWQARCKAAEIEWVANVLSAGLPIPILPWHPTAKGALTYAKIVGVAEVSGS